MGICPVLLEVGRAVSKGGSLCGVEQCPEVHRALRCRDNADICCQHWQQGPQLGEKEAVKRGPNAKPQHNGDPCGAGQFGSWGSWLKALWPCFANSSVGST